MQKTPIGRRIKLARENSDTSQVRLGALLDPPKSGSAIADIEAGKSAVTWDTVMQVSRVLEVPIDFFTELYCPECLRTYASGYPVRPREELDKLYREQEIVTKEEAKLDCFKNEELIRDVGESLSTGPLVGQIEQGRKQ